MPVRSHARVRRVCPRDHDTRRCGASVLREGQRTRALYQITAGKATVEVRLPGRPTAVVVARRTAGDLLGERSLLLGETLPASVVVESESLSVLRIKHAHLKKLFATSHPELPAKFYLFLARKQVLRMRMRVCVRGLPCVGASEEALSAVHHRDSAPLACRDCRSLRHTARGSHDRLFYELSQPTRVSAV